MSVIFICFTIYAICVRTYMCRVSYFRSSVIVAIFCCSILGYLVPQKNFYCIMLFKNQTF